MQIFETFKSTPRVILVHDTVTEPAHLIVKKLLEGEKVSWLSFGGVPLSQIESVSYVTESEDIDPQKILVIDSWNIFMIIEQSMNARFQWLINQIQRKNHLFIILHDYDISESEYNSILSLCDARIMTRSSSFDDILNGKHPYAPKNVPFQLLFKKSSTKYETFFMALNDGTFVEMTKEQLLEEERKSVNPVSTFNLGTTDKQKAVKDGLVLPFELADASDDYDEDEDDPDYDLEI